MTFLFSPAGDFPPAGFIFPLPLFILYLGTVSHRHHYFAKMVLSQPQDKHVLKAFDLTGKVAAVTGILSLLST